MPNTAKDTRNFLVSLLSIAGLPADPRKVIGQPFLFCDGEHFVVGAVNSIGYGKKEGLLLYVTPPRFRGTDIWRLQHMVGRWYVVDHRMNNVPGELIML